MTKREAAIVSAYTGILLGSFSDFHAYLEEKLNRPVYTHEIPGVLKQHKSLFKEDFIKIQVEDK
ncbi:MAG: hypothetical protein LUH48_02315 [Clostridiales bacterium]|nr:hypothetical protein [Clostridiales bacterium]